MALEFFFILKNGALELFLLLTGERKTHIRKDKKKVLSIMRTSLDKF